jgi:hypothetical protein
MKRTLKLSKETLRTLDEQDLSLVVGGSGSGSGSDHDHDHGHGHGHGKTGQHGSCNARSAKGKSCH